MDIMDGAGVSTLQLGFVAPLRDDIMDLIHWLCGDPDEDECEAAIVLQSKVRSTQARSRVQTLKLGEQDGRRTEEGEHHSSYPTNNSYQDP